MNDSNNFSRRNVSINSFIGKIMSFIGWSTSLAFLLTVGILTVVSIDIGHMMWMPILICSLFLGVGAGFLIKGKKIKSQSNRFKQYSLIIGDRKQTSIKSIADYTSMSVAFVAKDLQKMIDKDYFIDSYIDMQSKAVICNNGRISMPDFEEFNRKEPESKYENKETKQEKTGNSELDNIIAEGDKYLESIRQADISIKSTSMSIQIIRIEDLTEKIFDVIKLQPKKIADIRKFMEYYLPTTLKLLNSYSILENQGVNLDNIASTMKTIEHGMDTIVIAFEHQLDNLFKNEAMDVYTDMTVLKNILAQDGLIDSDF